MKLIIRFLSGFCFLPFLANFTLAQETIYWDMVAKIREEGFQRSQVLEYVSYLSDVVGPRLTASPNVRKAQDWTKSKMDEIGLVNTALEPWGEQFVSWDIEYISIHMVEPDYQVVIGYPLAFTPGTEGKVVNEVTIVKIKNKDDLKEYRGKLKDAIILATPKMPVTPRFYPDAFRHTEESLSVYATLGIDTLYKTYQKGQPKQQRFVIEGMSEQELMTFFKDEGVAVVLKASTGSDGTVLVSGRPGSNRDRSLSGVKKSLPILSIAAEHYNRIYRIAERGISVKMEIEVRIRAHENNPEGKNVVGEIQGSDLSHELVMLGAHMDSWHSGTGASDNASGVSVVLEAMRILKAIGAEPRRTIRAALWSCEEGGLKGSRGYVKHHFGNPEDGILPAYAHFSVYFNMDNGTGQFRGVHLQENNQVAPIFEAWMKPFHDLRMKTLSQYSNRGTDHLAFDQAGLPGFQFLQDRIDYRARTWHYNMDTYDHIVPYDLKINSVVMASFIYHAAMRDEKIPRKPFTNWSPNFVLYKPEIFKESQALTNAIADYDNDGDLDIFVGFNNKPNRLYRNDGETFTNVALNVGVADSDVTRTSAWGDYNGDGHLDLFVGFVSRSKSWNRLYRNEGNGKQFTDVTKSAGTDLSGSFRQASWIDYDCDQDVDLFIAFRDKANALMQNNGGKFNNVAKELGMDDSRRTVGAVWFDFDQDGDLDLYTANMDGDANGLFRNDGHRFVDVAKDCGAESGGRPLGNHRYGSVRPSLVDFNNDGYLDLFLANYGPNGLLKNNGDGTFENVAPKLGLAIDNCYDTGVWGDYDHNGRPDLFVNGTITRGKSYPDYLYHNDGDRFTDITPHVLSELHGDHGAHWVDFDQDGDLDLALTGAGEDGMHYLIKNNQSPERAKRSLQIFVLDENGHHTKSGTEVRLYQAGTNRLLGTGIFDTGSGYNSQNIIPIHFGLAEVAPVDVEVTTITKRGRVKARVSNVDPKNYVGSYLVVKVNNEGSIVE